MRELARFGVAAVFAAGALLGAAGGIAQQPAQALPKGLFPPALPGQAPAGSARWLRGFGWPGSGRAIAPGDKRARRSGTLSV